MKKEENSIDFTGKEKGIVLKLLEFLKDNIQHQKSKDVWEICLENEVIKTLSNTCRINEVVKRRRDVNRSEYTAICTAIKKMKGEGRKRKAKKKKAILEVTERELEVLFRNENIVWDPTEEKYRDLYKPHTFLQLDRGDYAAFCSVFRKIRELRRSMIHEDYHPL